MTPHCVYFITGKCHNIKIGRDPAGKIQRAIECKNMSIARELEYRLCAELEPYRVRNKWYNITASDVDRIYDNRENLLRAVEYDMPYPLCVVGAGPLVKNKARVGEPATSNEIYEQYMKYCETAGVRKYEMQNFIPDLLAGGVIVKSNSAEPVYNIMGDLANILAEDIESRYSTELLCYEY